MFEGHFAWLEPADSRHTCDNQLTVHYLNITQLCVNEFFQTVVSV